MEQNIQIDKLCKIIVHEGRLGLSAEMSKCTVQISGAVQVLRTGVPMCVTEGCEFV